MPLSPVSTIVGLTGREGTCYSPSEIPLTVCEVALHLAICELYELLDETETEDSDHVPFSQAVLPCFRQPLELSLPDTQL
jgi:hypothetical protein